MTAAPIVVEQVVQARLYVTTHRTAALRVALRYRSDDPLAVRMAFPAEFSLDGTPLPEAPPEVEWVFARWLLAAGLDAPSGIGDVHLRPAAAGRTMLELRSAEGVALLQFDGDQLRHFLAETLLAVPEGDEALLLDADRALAELLG
ncbi:SsgA family sporulation/cell division regulator [Streptomyces sp. NRRL B-24484]|uniref:SsgA family sporulation/cell division regulator n=1 Tax=Streptomyces sp. NRRL B-24484 TaxID=1463833 RepID=UPI0004C113D1|nr:SsgA family sporulation/cell division regulator [Streptomyces sp. NRRL B-24484]